MTPGEMTSRSWPPRYRTGVDRFDAASCRGMVRRCGNGRPVSGRHSRACSPHRLMSFTWIVPRPKAQWLSGTPHKFIVTPAHDRSAASGRFCSAASRLRRERPAEREWLGTPAPASSYRPGWGTCAGRRSPTCSVLIRCLSTSGNDGWPALVGSVQLSMSAEVLARSCAYDGDPLGE